MRLGCGRAEGSGGFDRGGYERVDSAFAFCQVSVVAGVETVTFGVGETAGGEVSDAADEATAVHCGQQLKHCFLPTFIQFVIENLGVCAVEIDVKGRSFKHEFRIFRHSQISVFA